MKDFVRTCALSKKWRYLRTSYPNLALFERNFSGRKQFTNFVDSPGLLSHKTRNVKRCFVHLSEIPGNFVLPYCLFSCTTLTRLTLSIPWALKLPSQIWLPNLKHLHLQCSTFVDKHSTEQLLSSCPVLEESTIRYCTWDNLKTLTTRAPMLKILTIQDEDFDCSVESGFRGSVIPNNSSDCPSVHPYGYRVVIYGNDLEGINCVSPLLNDHRVEKSCSLLHAYMDVPDRCLRRTQQVAYRLNKLLEGVCSIKRLTLSSKAIDHLPVFPKLEELDLGRLDLKHQVIVKLLHDSPNLETLRFSGSQHRWRAIGSHTPRCFSLHLRQIELSDVFLRKDFHVLEVLLKHAMVLEKLIICPKWHLLEQGIEQKFRQKLLEIPCRSESLEITFFGVEIHQKSLV
ncbi:hypothetical protein ACJRO7_021886 [Eucalyptus globulus]|uniref:F-box/LRR-repeat protein 15/At3g58940/PEG3-like LRR domain-containing protein n=1 Tax=Eucalyptus globulus TaxID=34317 RepID=A0ABD3KMY1_EUCGL